MSKPDPWLAVMRAERRVENMRYRHKVKLAKIASEADALLAELRTDLGHLETDIRAGRPREKIIDTIRAIRAKTPVDPTSVR